MWGAQLGCRIFIWLLGSTLARRICFPRGDLLGRRCSLKTTIRMAATVRCLVSQSQPTQHDITDSGIWRSNWPTKKRQLSFLFLSIIISQARQLYARLEISHLHVDWEPVGGRVGRLSGE